MWRKKNFCKKVAEFMKRIIIICFKFFNYFLNYRSFALT